MSKIFKGNLKVWLGKVFKGENKTKKFLNEVVAQLPSTESKQSKRQPDEIITDYVFGRIQELKLKNSTAADVLAYLCNFMKELEIILFHRFIEQIEPAIKRYLISNDENMRNYREVVVNICASQNKSIQCICFRGISNIESFQKQEFCYKCGQMCHVSCAWEKDKLDKLFECPMCFIKDCLPNKQIKQMVFAGYLRQSKKYKMQYKIQFFADLKKEKEKIIYEARCIRLNNKNRYELTWPQNCTMTLNQKKIADFKPLPFNSPLKRRNDSEIQLDKRNLQYKNTLVIEEKHQYIQGLRASNNDSHLIVIVAIGMIPQQQLIQQLSVRRLPADQSKQMLKDYLDRGMNDCVIQKINVSLKCQYYQTRIMQPVRSIHCISHYQPFDLESFITTNINCKNTTQRWKCPICRSRAYDLQVDQYLKSFISIKHNLSEITFDNSGQPALVEDELSEIDQEEEEDNKMNLIEDHIDNNSVQIIMLESSGEDKLIGNESNRQKNSKGSESIINIESSPSFAREDIVEKFNEPLPRKRNFIQLQIDNEECMRDVLTKKGKQYDKPMQNSTSRNPFSFLYVKYPYSMFKNSNSCRENHQDSSDLLSKSEKEIDQQVPLRMKQASILNQEAEHEKERDQNQKKKISLMSKTLIPSPSLKNTKLWDGMKAIKKSNEQLPMKCIETIEIDSDDESEQTIHIRKIEFQRAQLNKEKQFLIGKLQNCRITQNDYQVFNSICARLLNCKID